MSFLSSSIQGNSKVGEFKALIKELSNRIKRFPLVTEDLNNLETSLKNFENDGVNYLRLPNRSLISGLWVSWMAFKRQFVKIQKTDFLELIQKYLFNQIKSIETIYTQTVDHISSSTTDINEAIKEVPKSIKKLQKTAQKLPELALDEEQVLQHDIIYQAYKMFDNFNSETLSKYKALFEISNIDEFGTKSAYSMVLFHIKNCLDALTDSLSIDPKVHKSQFENYWTEEFHRGIWENQVKRSEQEIAKLFGKPPKLPDTKAQSDYPKKKKRDQQDLDTGTMFDSQTDANLHNRALLNDAKLDRIIKQIQELKQDVAKIQDDITDQNLRQDQFHKKQLTTEELEDENDKLCLDNNILITENKNLKEEKQRLQSLLTVAIQKLKGEGLDFEPGDLIEQINKEKNKLMIQNEELQKRLQKEQQISKKALLFAKVSLSPGSKSSFQLPGDSSSSDSSNSDDEDKARIPLNETQFEDGDAKRIWILYQKVLKENEIRRDQEEKNSKLLQQMEITKQKKHQYKSDAKHANEEIVKLQIELQQIKGKLVTLRNTKADENNQEIMDRLDDITTSIQQIGMKSSSAIDSKEYAKLTAENQSLKVKLEDKENKIKELKEQLAKLDDKNTKLQSQIISSQNDTAMQQLIQQEKNEKQQMIQKNEKLSKENQELNGTVKSLEEQVKTITLSVQSKENAIESLTKENTELKGTVKVLKKEIETVTTTVKTVQKANDQLQQEKTELDNKVKKLTTTVETVTTTVKTLKKANSDLQQNSQASGQELEKKNSELIDENNKLKSELEELKAKWEKNKANAIHNYHQAQLIEKENFALKNENKTLVQYRNMFDEVTSKRKKLDELYHDYGELQQLYNSTSNKLIKWKGKEIKREDAPAMWEKIKKEFEKYNSDFGKETYITVFHDNIRLIYANQQYKEISQIHSKQRAANEEQIAKLRSELEHLKAEKIVQSGGNTTKKIDELTKEIIKLQRQNTNYKEGLETLETLLDHKTNPKESIENRIEALKNSFMKKLSEGKYCHDLEQIPGDCDDYEKHMQQLTNIKVQADYADKNQNNESDSDESDDDSDEYSDDNNSDDNNSDDGDDTDDSDDDSSESSD